MTRSVAIAATVLLTLVGCGDGGGTQDAARAPRMWVLADTASEFVLWRSDDGGATWLAMLRRSQYAFNALTFVDRERGWLVGVEMMRTTDGGESWEPQSYDPGQGLVFRGLDVAFTSSERGVVAGLVEARESVSPYAHFGQVIETSDGGRNWRSAAIAPGNNLAYSPSGFASACLTTTGTALAVGGGGFNSVTSRSLALLRADEVVSWTNVFPDLHAAGAGFMNDSLRGVACVGGRGLWVVGRRRCAPFCEVAVEPASLLHSHDAGRTWEDASGRTPVASDAELVAVDFVGDHGWAVGSEGDGESQRLLALATIDGGTQWHRLNIPDDRVEELYRVDFGSSDDGLAVGWLKDGGALAYATRDGGQRWTPITLPDEIVWISDVVVVR